MQAIANDILKNKPNTKILYVSSEKFLNELINSIKNRSSDTEEFRQKYRNVDLLIMDDVQFLSGKESAQQELFNTFNDLHSQGKQIVLSADKAPKNIPVLEDRLKSRFNQGVIVDIGQPDFETRLAILKVKAEEKNIIIEDNILSLIADKIDTNIRDLEGVLNKVVVIASFTKMPITREITEKAINEISLERENSITPDVILDVIAKYFNVQKKDLLSTKKSQEIVFPRQIAMYLCRTELNLPYKKIGDIFGKKDHTTIMHAETKIKNSITMEKNTKLIVESVENILRSINE
jgi:chromosomal replication initiator protein dnaA